MMAKQEGYPSELQFPKIERAQEIPDYPPHSYPGSSTDPPDRENNASTKELENDYTEQGPSTDKLGRENTAYTKEPEKKSTEPGPSTDKLGRENTAYTKEPENQSTEPGRFHPRNQPVYYSNNGPYGSSGACAGPSGRPDYYPNQPGSTRNGAVAIPLPCSTTFYQPPSDHSCLSWCVLFGCAWIACCWPCAIAAVLESQKTRRDITEGNLISAVKHSRNARRWAILTMSLTISAYLLFMLIVRIMNTR
ncbi:uncharacterized protein LOC116307025 isoform X2 [Actinia tenebrosa]|uniref:Uncharacterized protein LOC116307025 isoform X2 n=1 Tax=Actinia tenebrosa TaxID=6105 RepID=A0A6P8J4W0_ACTTE|nr:uncharacterized protein LOC116307025 isoform X2 [Actinia tenebrosa]